jgi:pilus assembly protein CpaE
MTEKILVVDDDLESLKLISLMLRRQGYEVIVANSGSQALLKADIERPNLIILDVMMPDMDGYEVCRRMRANANTRPIPIIMFTAKTLIDDKVAGFEAGADDYLTKPTHPAELASRIKAVLSRNNTPSMSRRPQGIAIGFLGARGGIGTTTVLSNVAAVQAAANLRPIIVDFQFGGGQIAQAFGLTERLDGMVSVLQRPVAEIRGPLLMQHLLSHASGVRVLPASPNPKEAQTKYTADAGQAVIKGLKTIGTHVLCDLGSGYSDLVARVMPALDQMMFMVEPLYSALGGAERLLNVLRAEFKGTIHLAVVNRGATNRYVAPWSEVEARLGQSVVGMVSSAPEQVYQAAEAGQPLVVQQPNAVIANQLAKLAQAVNA